MRRHTKRTKVALWAILGLYVALPVVAASCERPVTNEPDKDFISYWYEDQHNLSAWAVYQQKETKDARK